MRSAGQVSEQLVIGLAGGMLVLLIAGSIYVGRGAGEVTRPNRHQAGLAASRASIPAAAQANSGLLTVHKDELSSLSPELQKILADQGWYQPYIAWPMLSAGSSVVNCRVKLKDDSRVGPRESYQLNPTPRLDGRPGVEYRARWEIAGIDHLSNPPTFRYIIWAWRDGTIQVNEQPFTALPYVIEHAYSGVGQESGASVIRVCLVDEQGVLRFVDSPPVYFGVKYL